MQAIVSVWVFNNKGVNMEEKIQAVAKLKAIQSYIYSLQEEYENLQDDDSFDDLQSYQKTEINAKENILREIKNFIENL